MNALNECDRLESYLSGDLAPADAAAFEIHLASCIACRETVDHQHWIDALLQSPIREHVESPSRGLVQAVARSLARQQRRRRLMAGGLAAAAMLLVAVGWSLSLSRQARRLEVNHIQGAALNTDVVAGAQLPVATFVGGEDVIVVPVESRHPNVTVVRCYRTYQSGLNAQAKAERSPNSLDTYWLNDLNGGEL